MPDKRPSVKNEKQYEPLKDKGMSKGRAAKIANSPRSLEPRRQEVGLVQFALEREAGRDDGQKKAAGRKGGKATARKKS